MGDWLGNDKITNQDKAKNRLPTHKAIQIIRELGKEYGLKNRKDWTKFARTHKKILEKLHLPVEPFDVYSKEKVWSKMKK